MMVSLPHGRMVLRSISYLSVQRRDSPRWWCRCPTAGWSSGPSAVWVCNAATHRDDGVAVPRQDGPQVYQLFECATPRLTEMMVSLSHGRMVLRSISCLSVQRCDSPRWWCRCPTAGWSSGLSARSWRPASPSPCPPLRATRAPACPTPRESRRNLHRDTRHLGQRTCVLHRHSLLKRVAGLGLKMFCSNHLLGCHSHPDDLCRLVRFIRQANLS